MTAAHDIARALGGKPNGDGFLCRCPVPGHGKRAGDRHPSLSVKDGDKVPLFKCFAGCDPRDVLDALRARGILATNPCTRTRAASSPPSPHDPDPAALEIWRNAKPAPGSIVETYLRGRGIVLPVPPSIRCGTVMHLGRYPMPIMVAAVQRPDGKIVSVQTTLLTHAGQKAPVAKPRITTGTLGEGAVRLAQATSALGLAEGIEDALSAMQLTGAPCWTSLGAGRMQRVAVPDHVAALHIFGDNDAAGIAAVERTAFAHRHRRVILRYPPEGVKDYNEFLRISALELELSA